MNEDLKQHFLLSRLEGKKEVSSYKYNNKKFFFYFHLNCFFMFFSLVIQKIFSSHFYLIWLREWKSIHFYQISFYWLKNKHLQNDQTCIAFHSMDNKMVRKCCVGGCDNNEKYPDKWIKCSHVLEMKFHYFLQDENARKIWHRNISRGRKNVLASD